MSKITKIPRMLRIVSPALGAICFFQCATAPPQQTNDVLLPEIDIIKVKENSDEALKLSRETRLDIDAINTKLIEMDNKLLIINEELASMSAAKLEELENRLSILSEELRFLSAEVQKTQKKESGNKGPAFAPNTFTPNPKPSGKKPEVAETEAQDYKSASDLFYARKYTQAIEEYNKLIKKYPKGAYVDNAVFWKGESEFALGNYSKAISSYQMVFGYAKSEKIDDAQFKIGLSYLRMGDNKQAVVELQKLLSLYPDSEYIGRTKQELRKIK